MARDAIAEWRRALMRRCSVYAMFAKTRGLALPPQAGDAGGILLMPFDMSKTRPLASAARFASDRGDLSTAICVLQRHNRLLRARFGVGWADATNFVLGESHRRGTTATLMARAVSRQLRAAAT